MKMFKRLAAVLLAGVMALAMLTACGTAESDFEAAVQAAYMVALNDEFGTNLSNDSDVKAYAKTLLDNVVNGEVSQKGVAGNKEIDGGDSVMTALICVEDAAQVKDAYTAIHYDEMTAETITPDAASIGQLKVVLDYTKQVAGQAGKSIELAGLGVATKTVDGKTYVAIGFKLTKSAK